MTTQPSFELYAYWRTSATYRVRVALNLKGLKANERIVNIDAGEQRDEEFLKINPLGAIPALVEIGHAPLTQSLAILEFLEEFQPAPPLLPQDLHGRARVRSIAAMLASDTHPLITARQKIFDCLHWNGRHGLACMADPVVWDWLVRPRAAPGRGAADRRILSWRHADNG